MAAWRAASGLNEGTGCSVELLRAASIERVSFSEFSALRSRTSTSEAKKRRQCRAGAAAAVVAWTWARALRPVAKISGEYSTIATGCTC